MQYILSYHFKKQDKYSFLIIVILKQIRFFDESSEENKKKIAI